MIFGRRGGSHRHARAGEGRRSGPRHAAVDRYADGYDENGYDDEPGTGAGRGGPFDISEAPEGVPRLDLGSLQVPAIDGVEVRVQANPDGQIQQVVLVNGPNALQLGVFAAPRSEGIWDDVRNEIRKSLFNDGVAAEENDGEFGIELRARVRTPDGLTDIRFVGVDGPRWMVRGVYQGPAAVDPANAGPLAVCLRELVVDRGQEAKPVREPLPLRLPREAVEGVAAAPVDAAGQVGPGPAGQAGPAGQVGQAGQVGPAGQVGLSAAAPRPGEGVADMPAPASASSPPRRKPSPRPRRTP